MSVLTIIGGPNGAGKSTHSKELLAHSGIEAFDFDKEFYSIWSQFSFDPLIEQGAFSRAQDLYVERRSLALKHSSDFAFETNFHTDQILAIADLFRANGYLLELIFICLENVETAIERVKDRVAKGGHAVAEAVVRERFTKGLDLLNKSFDRFDAVYLYLSKHKRIEGLAVLEPSVKRITSNIPIPASLELRLPRLKEFVMKNS